MHIKFDFLWLWKCNFLDDSSISRCMFVDVSKWKAPFPRHNTRVFTLNMRSSFQVYEGFVQAGSVFVWLCVCIVCRFFYYVCVCLAWYNMCCLCFWSSNNCQLLCCWPLYLFYKSAIQAVCCSENINEGEKMWVNMCDCSATLFHIRIIALYPYCPWAFEPNYEE